MYNKYNNDNNYFNDRVRVVGIITIIVIIALVTIFAFTSLKEKKNTAWMLRSFYSDMAQAMQFAVNNNGQPSEWFLAKGKYNVAAYKQNLFKFLKYSKICTKGEGDCMPETNYLSLSDKETDLNLSKLLSVKMRNGVSFAIDTLSSCQKQDSVCALVYVDINGASKPNVIGKDLFAFLLLNSMSTNFIPYNIKMPEDKIFNDEKLGCNKKAEKPLYCSCVLYSNGWRVDNKYPW